MTGTEGGHDDRWVDGTLESGADSDQTSETDQIPNPQTGVGIGAGKASSFEPEEDTEAVNPPQ
jgi:hypothetical protein